MVNRQVSIHGDNTSWTITDFRDWEGMRNFSDEIRAKVNTAIREHIKNALHDSIRSTKKEIKYNTKFNRKYGDWTLIETLGSSLQFGLKQGSNQHQSQFIIGSYDWDETAPEIPTGVRGSNMTKNDKSLTEVYEEGQGPFRMKGFIGGGANDTALSGYVSPGRNADWKRLQDNANRVFISEKGYGLGLERRGKAIAKVTHSGWRGVGMMSKLQENVNKNLERGKDALRKELETITSNFKRQDRENINDAQTMAYYSFKGQ
tara:strand:- start:1545 stop:2324 length:780 start_codon:yes stop_codon:yes gene_type:complete